MEITIVYWDYMETLQCSSFLGLVVFFLVRTLIRAIKKGTLEGLGKPETLNPKAHTAWAKGYLRLEHLHHGAEAFLGNMIKVREYD